MEPVTAWLKNHDTKWDRREGDSSQVFYFVLSSQTCQNGERKREIASAEISSLLLRRPQENSSHWQRETEKVRPYFLLKAGLHLLQISNQRQV